MLIPLECPNCGAPVRGGECEYCGTVFERAEKPEEYFIYRRGEPVFTDAENSVNGIPRTVRRFSPEAGTYEWVAENPAKSVSTPDLPTKMQRW